MPHKVKPLSFLAKAKIAAAEGEGKTRTFTLNAYTGEAMNIWPYELPIVVDLDTVDLSAQTLPALYDHCPAVDFVVGQIESVKVAGGALQASGRFTVQENPSEWDIAAKVLAKADAGYQWQVSVGGNPKTLEEVAQGASATVNGRNYPGPCLIARGLELREISFVVLGGDRRTSALVAKGRKIMAMSFEEFVVSKGFEDVSALTETQSANMKQWFASEYAEEEPKEEAAAAEGDMMPDEEKEEAPPTAAAAKPAKIKASNGLDVKAKMRKDAADEMERQTAIQARAKRHGITEAEVDGVKVDLVAHAIRENWTPDQTELVALRSARTQGPAIIVRSHERDCSLQSLQAAMILRAGGKVDQKFKPGRGSVALNLPQWLRAGVNDAERNKVMDSAHRYAQLSMIDIAREACRIDGHTVSASDTVSELLQTALKPSLRAASSGGALTNIFSTSIHAVLLASYEQFEDTTGGWISETDVANFQTQERARIDIGGGLKKLPRGNTAEHASYSDSVESYKAARYAKMFEVDEQDFMDDNLGGLASVPQEMGQAAARLRPDLVYAILLDNPTLSATARQLFNTTDGSLASSGTALAMASLGTAVKNMLLYRENSVNLGLQPTHLLLPPALEMIGIELTQSSLILYGADDETVRGNMNAMKLRGIQPVVEPRLENGVTDPNTGDSESGSATAWYLVCNRAHTIEVGYVRGSGRSPRVRNYVLDKGRYGLGWDVSMDIGAKALDWKGFHKNAGT